MSEWKKVIFAVIIGLEIWLLTMRSSEDSKVFLINSVGQGEEDGGGGGGNAAENDYHNRLSFIENRLGVSWKPAESSADGLDLRPALPSKEPIAIPTKSAAAQSSSPAARTVAAGATLSREQRIEKRLFRKISKIRDVCGDVCNTTITGPLDEASGLHVVQKRFNCSNIFNTAEFHDEFDSDEIEAPFSSIPGWLLPDFTYQGRIWYHNSYYIKEEFRTTKEVLKWSTVTIDQSLQRILLGNLGIGPYGTEAERNILAGLHKMNLAGKNVLVIGSQSPWLEALILSTGVSHVLTVEYSRIECNHPKLSSMTPKEFISSYISGVLGQFDAMVTFSSLEHSGLGRYGDGIHPWGDLVVMSRVWCVLKPGGLILFGGPASKVDQIVYNAHKCYGLHMLSQVLANFEFQWTSHPKMEGTNCKDHVQIVVVAQKRA